MKSIILTILRKSSSYMSWTTRIFLRRWSFEFFSNEQISTWLSEWCTLSLPWLPALQIPSGVKKLLVNTKSIFQNYPDFDLEEYVVKWNSELAFNLKHIQSTFNYYMTLDFSANYLIIIKSFYIFEILNKKEFLNKIYWKFSK